MKPSLRIDVHRRESSDAFCKEDVITPQIDAELKLLHRTSQRSVRLNVRDHAAAYCPLSFVRRLPLLAIPQCVHLVNTLLHFEFADFLTLDHVTSEVSIALGLRYLHGQSHARECLTSCIKVCGDTLATALVVLMGLGCNRH